MPLSKDVCNDAPPPTRDVAKRGPANAAVIFSALATLVARLDDRAARQAGVIPWGCPVPSFGDLANACVATLGLNPSNREFVDDRGRELRADQRRFHTLRSLDLKSWSDANTEHLERILEACRGYFAGNSYDRWFKPLDVIISGTGASFYDADRPACHLDVIPYATGRKWMELSAAQRSQLLALSADTLGLLLRNTPVQLLILNGQSVVTHFQAATDIVLNQKEMPDWSLPRQSGVDVRGVAYYGVVDTISGYRLRQDLLVLGYNHNLQSSYGVTGAVVERIRQWVEDLAQEALR